MLQQTRVDQATPYYHRFLERFPDVFTLANADLQDLLLVWEGLGYYSRARNLHKAAKQIAGEFGGTMPETWDEITSLKGIGPYTAAAVLSIAYGKSHAVMDGNVMRVISRYFGIANDLRSTVTQKEIKAYADDLIDPANPGDFNQGLMELGATVCTPKNAKCFVCPLAAHCVAYRTAATDILPYKSPKKKVPHHNIGVGIIRDEAGRLLIALRPEEAMLGGLWEFPGGKQNDGETIQETVKREIAEELGVDVLVRDHFMDVKHAYSHFKITLQAWFCELVSGTPQPKSSQRIEWISVDQIHDFPFPKANRKITEALAKQLG